MKSGGLRFTEDRNPRAVPRRRAGQCRRAHRQHIEAIDAPYLRGVHRPMATQPRRSNRSSLHRDADGEGRRMNALMTAAGAEGRHARRGGIGTNTTRPNRRSSGTTSTWRGSTCSRRPTAPRRAGGRHVDGDGRELAHGRATRTSPILRPRQSAARHRVRARDHVQTGRLSASRARSPLAVAKARYPDNHRVLQYLERAAVPAHTTVNTSALMDPTNLTRNFWSGCSRRRSSASSGWAGCPT